jgi:hypothetical protein
MGKSDEAVLKAKIILEERREKHPAAVSLKKRARKSRADRIFNRVLRILGGLLAVAIGAAVFSATVAPLGFWGVLIVPLLMLLVTLILARYPKRRMPKPESFAKADLPALGSQVETWIDLKRKALPAPARGEAERILLTLDTLTPQLDRLAATSVEASQARRLMAEHLPRLVETWEKVPAQVRSNNREADRQLAEGLKLVGDELERLTHALTKDSLEALEVEGRFLESRYRDQKRLGN